MKRILAILLLLAVATAGAKPVYLITTPPVTTEEPAQGESGGEEMASLPAPVVVAPTTSFPVGFAAFGAPLDDGLAGSSAVQIAEYTRQADAGDTITISAEGSPDAFLVTDESGASEEATVRQVVGRMFAITLPGTLAAGDMYLVHPVSGAATGTPVRVNSSDGRWISPASVAEGDTFSIYGRGLELDGVAHAYIDGFGWIESVAANPYKADFVMPSVGNGSHTIYPHNGHCGKYGFSDALTVAVDNTYPWNDDTNTWIRVKASPYNAQGDGTSEDGDAINAALVAANAIDHSTVYIEEGAYLTHRSWHSLTDVRVVGDGMDRTVIRTSDTYGSSANESYGIFYNNFGECVFKDFAIELTDSITNGMSTDAAFYQNAQAGNITIDGVRIDNRPTTVDAGQSIIHTAAANMPITIRNSEFYIREHVNIVGAPQVTIDGCDFVGMWDVNILVNIPECRNISITDCTARSLDIATDTSRTWCQGRVVHAAGSTGGLRNLYISGLTTTDLMVRPGYAGNQNTGEQILFDITPGQYEGSPSAVADSTTMTLSGLAADHTGESITVIEGRGIGQTRHIASYNAGSITVDKPWRVAPDTDSVLRIAYSFDNIVAYDNDLDGISKEDGQSSAGLEIYGGGSGVAFDNNRVTDVRKGICLWADYVANGMNGSIAFSEVRNNTVSDSKYAFFEVYDDYNGTTTLETPVQVGNVFANNTADNCNVAYFLRNDTSNQDCEFLVTVLDGNSAINCATNIGFYTGFGFNLDVPDAGLEADSVQIGNNWQ